MGEPLIRPEDNKKVPGEVGPSDILRAVSRIHGDPDRNCITVQIFYALLFFRHSFSPPLSFSRRHTSSLTLRFPFPVTLGNLGCTLTLHQVDYPGGSSVSRPSGALTECRNSPSAKRSTEKKLCTQGGERDGGKCIREFGNSV